MGYTKISTNKTFVKLSECTDGDVLVDGGVYLGSSMNKFKNLNHEFRTKDKGIVVISSGSLNYIVENHLTVNDVVRITYKGTIKLSKGAYAGKPCHQFEVEKDEAESYTSKEEFSTPVEEEVVAPKGKSKGKISLDDLD